MSANSGLGSPTARTSSVSDGGMPPAEEFFLHSSLQFMEELAARRAKIQQLLPFLNDLVDPAQHAWAPKDATAIAQLRDWVQAQNEEHENRKRMKVTMSTHDRTCHSAGHPAFSH